MVSPGSMSRSCHRFHLSPRQSHRLWLAHEQTRTQIEQSVQSGVEPASATAARVLRIEGEAVLSTWPTRLPADFDAAVDAILATRGRVILGGIGKSGHIARKISSTLASTGTPSAFVHAAEASHGDLGMITPGDLVILISKSGETSELRDIVAHVTRFSIPMIGISGKDTARP
jgi:D-arabinose 5-phosphate isomerase GutQ